ncbi:hypothetical protein E1B28_005659 [Marasmius oreades]|uniref:Uncharacterized protein n=1 Tax=Marasmius oreades TaxID=181124 RepID=A0A9P7S524_9AGAR|nr:uncharacterized protein E1B28_005659 [Marasmius oreades]KAG7094851.1 hypothetical protein E1B28_005659 [Marasmius oreades]
MDGRLPESALLLSLHWPPTGHERRIGYWTCCRGERQADERVHCTEGVLSHLDIDSHVRECDSAALFSLYDDDKEARGFKAANRRQHLPVLQTKGVRGARLVKAHKIPRRVTKRRTASWEETGLCCACDNGRYKRSLLIPSSLPI